MRTSMGRSCCLAVLATATCCFLVPASGWAQDWPQWRGPSETNVIMAIAPDDGEILWSTTFGVAGLVGNTRSGNTFPGPRCTPTVDGDMIYGVDHHGGVVKVGEYLYGYSDGKAK